MYILSADTQQRYCSLSHGQIIIFLYPRLTCSIHIVSEFPLSRKVHNPNGKCSLVIAVKTKDEANFHTGEMFFAIKTHYFRQVTYFCRASFQDLQIDVASVAARTEGVNMNPL